MNLSEVRSHNSNIDLKSNDKTGIYMKSEVNTGINLKSVDKT